MGLTVKAGSTWFYTLPNVEPADRQSGLALYTPITAGHLYYKQEIRSVEHGICP